MRDDVSRQRRTTCVCGSQNISEIKRSGKTNGYDHKQDGGDRNKEPSPTRSASVHARHYCTRRMGRVHLDKWRAGPRYLSRGIPSEAAPPVAGFRRVGTSDVAVLFLEPVTQTCGKDGAFSSIQAIELNGRNPESALGRRCDGFTARNALNPHYTLSASKR